MRTLNGFLICIGGASLLYVLITWLLGPGLFTTLIYWVICIAFGWFCVNPILDWMEKK